MSQILFTQLAYCIVNGLFLSLSFDCLTKLSIEPRMLDFELAGEGMSCLFGLFGLG